MQVVRINQIGGRWWLQPSSWTFSRSRWAPRVYVNLKKLLATEGLLNENFIISLNKDKELTTYRMLQQMRDLRVFLSNKDVEQIMNGTPLDYKLPRRKLVLRFDKKSIKHLRAGFLPFFSSEYLWENRSKTQDFDYCVLIWRKDGFSDISAQVQKDKSLKVSNVVITPSLPEDSSANASSK